MLKHKKILQSRLIDAVVQVNEASKHSTGIRLATMRYRVITLAPVISGVPLYLVVPPK